MPLDPSIPGLALRGMNQVQPLDIQEAMVQRDRQRLIQAQTEKAQREATDQQRLQQLAQQFGDDPDRLASELDHVDPMLGQKYRGAVWDTRQKVASTYLEQSKARQSELSEAIDDLHMATPENWDTFVPEFLKKHPAMSPVLSGQPYNPALIDHISTAAMTEAQRVEAKRQASKQLMEKDTVGFVANMIASAETPQQQAENAKLFPMLGVTPIANRFQTKEDAQAYLEKQAKAAPSTAAKVGTFEDYVVRTYGPDPTPAQILAARKAYGQADDKAKVSVSVSGGVGATPATIEQMARGSGYTVDGLKKAARAYHESGQLPALGNRAATKIAIQNAEALIYGPEGDMAMTGAGFKANQGALNALTKQLGAVQAYERTSLGNLKQFTDLAKSIPDTGIPWLNTPVRALSSNLVGSTNMAAVNAARQVALTEIAKVVSNPNLTGALSDSAREEVLGLIPENATFKQIRRVAQVLEADMARRPASMQKQIADIKYEMSHPGETAPQTTVPDAPIGQYDVKAPNGKVYHFSTKAQSDTFKKSAGLQ